MRVPRATGGFRRGPVLPALLVTLLALLAPGPAEAQTGGIFGFVVNENGAPIPNARVRAAAGPNVGAQTVSASNGSYSLGSLAAGIHEFTAARTGFTEDRRTVRVLTGESSRVDFVLTTRPTSGGALEGFVTRRGTNQPIPGAQLLLTSPLGSSTQFTDASGFYRFSGLAAGSYAVTVSRTGFTPVSASGLTIRNASTTLADFQLSIRSAELGTLRGQVTDTTGRGIRSARVRLLDGASVGATATADTQGRYLIRFIIPDTYTVAFEAAGFQSTVISNVTVNAARETLLDQALTSATAADSTLTGLVSDSFGPLFGARVELVTGPLTGAFDVTGRDGAYLLEGLPAGTYVALATASGYLDNLVLVSLGSRETRTLDFFMVQSTTGRGAVAGRVTDPSGAALPGARVRVTAGPSTGHSTTTDEDGEYAIRDLVEGTYALTFQHTGFADQTVTGVPVVARQTTPLDVQLGAQAGGGTLTGTVRNSTGSLQGVLVEVRSGSTLVASTTTNASGVYTLPGIPAGTYAVRFSRSGFDTATENGVVITAGATTTLNETLIPSDGGTGTLTGLVQDSASLPLQGVLVEVLSGSQSVGSGTTGSDGRYTVTGIPIGTYTVRFALTGFTTASFPDIPIGQASTTTLNATLTSGGGGGTGTIRGTVVDAVGESVQGALVEATGPAFSQSTTTDASGRFTFTNVPAGTTYRVRVTRTGFIPGERSPVTVRAGETTQLTFTLVPQAAASGIIALVRSSSPAGPIAGASVAIVSGPVSGQRATTNAAGRVAFTRLPAGTYTLQVSAPGFRTVRRSVLVQANTPTVTIFLPRL